MKKIHVWAALAGGLLTAAPAAAHETGIAHEAGALHPILGIDHILLVLAIAALAGAWALWRR